MIRIQEDKQFLIEQRKKGRSGKIGGLDKALVKKEAQAVKKKDRLKRMLEEENIRSITKRNPISIFPSTSEDDEERKSLSPTHSPSTSQVPPKKRGRKKLVDDDLAVSLDVAKLSDRKAAVVLTITLKCVGCDPSTYNVNTSSIRRQRIKCRQKIAESLKSVFKPEVPLTIHWDGKMIEDISGHEIVDRLPILVSGKSVDQLLAVPKLASGTGESAASAVYKTLLTWGLSEHVKCMSFDTTASNTGPRNGACILLKKLKKIYFGSPVVITSWRLC